MEIQSTSAFPLKGSETETSPQSTKKKGEVSSQEQAKKREPSVNTTGEKNFYEAQAVWKDLRFHQHAESGRTIIDVINRETGEVIKTIPEEELADFISQQKEASGVLLDIQG